MTGLYLLAALGAVVVLVFAVYGAVALMNRNVVRSFVAGPPGPQGPAGPAGTCRCEDLQ